MVVLLAAVLALLDQSRIGAVQARKPSRPRGPPARRGPPPSSRKPPSRRRPPVEDEYDEDDPYGSGDDSEDEGILGRFPGESDEEEEEFDPPPRKRRSPTPAKSRPGKKSRPPPRKRPPPSREYDDDYEEEYDEYERRPSRPSKRGGGSSKSRRGGPPPRRGPPSRNGRVVPYGRRKPAAGGAAATLTKGWTAFTSVMPDPSTVRDGVASSITAARETTSLLSSNIYREVKGLTSSELEQVMLKATRPDDTPVKGKHVERLVGVTYQISSRYDIYDAVLRKLWGKMAEKDWRTSIKALYILHRFSADGAPEHAQALKARLRELRRTKDPKRKDKYFNSKQMLAGDAKVSMAFLFHSFARQICFLTPYSAFEQPENMRFRAFMGRYSHYVLLRAQCFGGIFDEISQKPAPSKRDKKSKAAPKMKPITSTNLRIENLEAAKMLLKAGVGCQLKEGEACENTAIAAERVASDMIGLTTAVAIALNRALKGDSLDGADPAIIKKWCEFYSEALLPQSRAMVKKTSSKLDAFGLFLPSRMGASLTPEILQKGLRADEMTGGAAPVTDEEEEEAKEDNDADEEEKAEEAADDDEEEEEEEEAEKEPEDEAALDDGDEYDEYEYEEEEFYDDED